MTGHSTKPAKDSAFIPTLTPNPVTMPQKAPDSVMRLLHTLINATTPHEEANNGPAK